MHLNTNSRVHQNDGKQVTMYDLLLMLEELSAKLDKQLEQHHCINLSLQNSTQIKKLDDELDRIHTNKSLKVKKEIGRSSINEFESFFGNIDNDKTRKFSENLRIKYKITRNTLKNSKACQSLYGLDIANATWKFRRK